MDIQSINNLPEKLFNGSGVVATVTFKAKAANILRLVLSYSRRFTKTTANLIRQR